MEDEPITVLVVEGNPEEANSLRKALAEAGGEFRTEWVGWLSAGLERLRQGGVEIVLLSLTLPDSQGFETFVKTLDCAKGIPVIVISNLDDSELALRAVREGAEDYLVKGRMSGPSLVRCLRHAVERHKHIAKLLQDVRQKGGGTVLGFLGVKGGVGATTLTLNIAAALAQQGAKVIAVELVPFSNFSLHLRKSASLGLGDLLDLEPERITSRALNEKLVSLPFGFRALFAPARIKMRSEIPAEQVSAVIQAAAAISDFTIVDLPSQIVSTQQTVGSICRFIGVVLEPEPLAVESARTALEKLGSWGIDSNSYGLIVVNRVPLSNSIRLSDVRARVDCGVLGMVPPAPEACILAHETGKPLFLAQPEARFSLAIKEIADNLVQSPVRMLRI